MLKVQKAYYCEYGYWTDEYGRICCDWGITVDENEARELDANYRLANISEVNEWISLVDDVIPIVEVQNGVYGYVKIEYINSFDEEECHVGYDSATDSSWEMKFFPFFRHNRNRMTMEQSGILFLPPELDTQI